MIRFVNINNGCLYKFDSWEDIVKLGGLKSIILPKDYDYVYNEAACKETIAQTDLSNDTVRLYSKGINVSKKEAIKFLEPFKKAIKLFNN